MKEQETLAMFSLFKKAIRNYRSIGLCLILFVVFPILLQAQSNTVIVNTVVYPPFSTQFSDYISNPNKISVTLINNSSTTVYAYLSGSFTSDNGISISSESGYKPPTPIALEPNIPFQLTLDNIGNIFSDQHLVYSGITKQDLVNMQGVPEGNYQICFTVFDYYTDKQLSLDEPSGCSNIIMVQYVDPPVILNPYCGDSIVSSTPQNLLFSWTIPVQTSTNLKYRFIMTEIHPDDRNPYDAMASAVPPYFFEKELSINQLQMGPSDPQLIEGRSYAFLVQALDPDDRIVFKNNGASEVCWFKYKGNSLPIELDTTVIISDTNDFTNDFDFIPNTTISGQLRYKLASEAGAGSSSSSGNSGGRTSIPGGINFTNLNNNTGNGNANTGFTGLGGYYGHFTHLAGATMNPPFGKGVINDKTFSANNAEPLRNTKVRLAVRFSIENSAGDFEVRSLNDGGWGGQLDINSFTFYDLNGQEISKEKVLSTVNKILDVCTTDAQGNYSFNFMTDFFTGPVYATSSGNSFGKPNYNGVVSLRIEVENQKFCSPDILVYAKQGDIVNNSPQVALIKDYDMHLTVVSAYDVYNHVHGNDTVHLQDYDIHQKAIAGGEPIPNAIVRVLRNTQKLANEHPAILLSEGSGHGGVVQNKYGEFKEVFRGLTDAEGKIDIPHLVEHWAITDGEDQSPYLFYVSTRKENMDSAYSETLYNYEPFFGSILGIKISVDAGGPTQLDDDAGYNGMQPVTYNSFYAPPHSARNGKLGLVAAKPEIQGRVMVASNLENIPLQHVKVSLIKKRCQNCNGLYNEGFAFTNKAGFFRFPHLNVDYNENGEARGPWRRMILNYTPSPSLYKTILWPTQDKPAINAKYGELYFHEFQMEPEKRLRGKVQDEQGHPVASYVKLLPGYPYVKTEKRWEYDNDGNIYVSGESFEIAASNGTNQFEVQPLSNNYFADTITVTSFQPGHTKTFTVYRKMHRLKIQLYNKTSHGVIAGATVLVGDTLAIAQTNSAGVAELVFASPGQQFLVRVFSDNYAPIQASYNIPVSKTWQQETLQLQYALHISGTVTESGSGTPVDSAMVYTELQNTDGHTLFLETYTDANGNYRLNGLPSFTTPTDVEVHTVKSGSNPSYVGQAKTVTVKSSMVMSGYDFQIIKADGWDLSKIWGFPVTVEGLTTRKNFGTRINGYFYNLPHHPDFNTINSNEKVYFKNVKVTRGPNGEIVPVNDAVVTRNYSLPVKIKGGFEGDLSVYSYNDPFLKVKKAGDYGKMSGNLKIDLSSFNFVYDFTGNLYLGDDTTKTDITPFMSHGNGSPGNNSSYYFYSTRHYLFDQERWGTLSSPKPINNFRAFGFNASSNFKGSYLENGVIHIATILHTDIAMPLGRPSLDLKIDAGEIQITKDNMDLVHKPNSQLSFELEKWRIKSTDGWTFDKTRDAIVLPKAVIYTGLGVDPGIKGLNIRPDALREGKIDLSKGLTLGNIATLTINDALKPVFNYDAGVGHYRISMVGSTNDPVAWINNLPATPDRLEFSSIGMLSDNSTVLVLDKKMRFHNLMDIYVNQIMSGEGFFRLAGTPDLGIPGYVPSRAEVTYTKENGKLKFTLEPLSGGIDCNANIDYTLEQIRSSQSLTNKLYTTFGTFNIKPPPDKGGEKLHIRGFLTKTPTECYIDVVTPQTIKMGKEKFDLIDGKIAIKSNTWGELNFTAHTHSTGLDDSNVLAFNVHGGLEATSSGIKANNINTPLGDLNIAYLFPEKALVGNLTITKKIEMGFASINSGMMDMRFDPAGFYIAFFGDVTMTAQNYLGGFVMGVYDNDLTSTCNKILSPFRKNPPALTSIHGLYVIGQRNLADYSIAIPIAPPLWVSFKAGIGAYVHLDYSNPTVVVGGYAFVDASGGYYVPLCSFIGVDLHAYFDVSGGYENNALFIKSCGQLDAGVNACGLQGGITLTNKCKLSSNGDNKFSLKLGGSCK